MTDLTDISDREVLDEIGRRLRAARKAQGMTILDVAARSRLHRTTVSKAESGENPTLLTVVKMLRVYRRVGELDQLLREAPVSPMKLLAEQER